MGMILLGIFAFLLFYMYDYRQLTKPHQNHFAFFAAGILLLVGATAGLVVMAWKQGEVRVLSFMLSIPFGIVALLLLFYTLFFAIPYEDSYQNPSGKKTLVSTGVYALCRHPGILWFAALYFFLWLAVGGSLLLLAFVLFSSLNGLYAYLQDRWVFPLQFEGYELYQQNTPFLIPTRESLGACVSTFCSRNTGVGGTR